MTEFDTKFKVSVQFIVDQLLAFRDKYGKVG